MPNPDHPRPILVPVAAAVFLGNVALSAVLYAAGWVAAPLPETLVALGIIGAVLALQLWIASALLRGTRRGWYAGIAFAVFMLLPIGWDATLPLPNVVVYIVSTGAFAFVLVALLRERKWFQHPSLDPVRHRD